MNQIKFCATIRIFSPEPKAEGGKAVREIEVEDNSEVDQEGLDFIGEYNLCFYHRDIDALKQLYATSAFTVFWDNHSGCDSRNLEDHFSKVSEFFQKGKQTESGEIEPLLIEDAQIRSSNGFALVTAFLRYQSAPTPGVRSTFVLIRDEGRWKAIHIHHSFDPNEAP